MNMPHSSETSPHDWASLEYVRFWAERSDREESERRYRFDLMTALIPHPKDASIAILDMGAGYGALTAVLLEHFPAAQATCLDGSQAMLELLESRQVRFRDRIATVLTDYSRPDWSKQLRGAQFDVVVSSQATHGLRERRRDLYREIYGLLNPGGCFFNADLVPAATESLHRRFRDVQIRRRMARVKQASGIQPTYDEIAAEVDGLRPGQTVASSNPSISRWNPGDWLNDLQWLRDGGFVDVDCFWKELRVAIVGGYKAQGNNTVDRECL